jgi:hypothetical protein
VDEKSRKTWLSPFYSTVCLSVISTLYCTEHPVQAGEQIMTAIFIFYEIHYTSNVKTIISENTMKDYDNGYSGD